MLQSSTIYVYERLWRDIRFSNRYTSLNYIMQFLSFQSSLLHPLVQQLSSFSIRMITQFRSCIRAKRCVFSLTVSILRSLYMSLFLAYQRNVNYIPQYFVLQSLNYISICESGTTPELYSVYPYWFQNHLYIYEQLITYCQLRIMVQHPVHFSIVHLQFFSFLLYVFFATKFCIQSHAQVFGCV